ncbi:hypothetical protein LTR27_009378 [Elasticomyces elasticus]|nr:hypothetical protein LTR27_009378 [Elasticomyces elasticus]
MAYSSEPRAALAECALPRLSTELLVASPSPTLLTIPPEMRNIIYELVFGTQPEEADLLNPTPSSKALLLGCTQVYEEAKGLYSTAYRAYWPKTYFVVHYTGVTEYATSLTRNEMEAVNRLQFTFRRLEYHDLFGSRLEYLRLAPTGPGHENDLIRYARRPNGRWVCTTQINPGSSGLRPRVLLSPQRGHLVLEESNAEDLATLQSYPQETQWSAHRRIIEKEDLDLLLGCELKLAEVDDKQW